MWWNNKYCFFHVLVILLWLLMVYVCLPMFHGYLKVQMVQKVSQPFAIRTDNTQTVLCAIKLWLITVAVRAMNWLLLWHLNIRYKCPSCKLWLSGVNNTLTFFCWTLTPDYRSLSCQLCMSVVSNTLTFDAWLLNFDIWLSNICAEVCNWQLWAMNSVT